MNPRVSAESRGQRVNPRQSEGPNWILIAGGALLSMLSIRLGYKLKQTLEPKQRAKSGNEKPADRRRHRSCHLHSNMYSLQQGNDVCFHCVSGNSSMELKRPPSDHAFADSDGSLPLVTMSATEFHKENGVIWSSSPDRLELPPKLPFHHSNCSDSPRVSESSSDIFSKREVIEKLRQQLKRRDDMIVEMQDQIGELQNSVNSQVANSTHLQSQLDASNRELFESEREIQRLRKAIADQGVTNDQPSNGLTNGWYIAGERNFEVLETGRDVKKIEMLKREVGELKEVIEGKEYLLQNYKEQKTELSMKINELQQRLDSQLPNIL